MGGKIHTAALGSKINVRILSFLSETISWERADACLWEQTFDLRTSQKLCRSSRERIKTLQNCFTTNAFKHKSAVSSLSEAGESHCLIKSPGTSPTRLETNTLDTCRQRPGTRFGCSFAGNRFCSSRGSRRREPTPRWPGPLQVWL